MRLHQVTPRLRQVTSSLLAVVALSATTAGCATPQAPVQVVANNYCEIATKQKRTWSVNDTTTTIAEAVRINAGIDKACGVKRIAQQ